MQTTARLTPEAPPRHFSGPKRWLLLVGLAVCYGLVAGSPVEAQVQHLSRFVTGKVFAGEALLPGATIELVSNGGSLTAISDQSGRFLIPNPPSGSYTIRAKFGGTVATEEQIQLEQGRSTSHDIVLNVDAPPGSPGTASLEPPQGRSHSIELSRYLEMIDGWEEADTEALLNGFDLSSGEEAPAPEEAAAAGR